METKPRLLLALALLAIVATLLAGNNRAIAQEMPPGAAAAPAG